ncbi:MAG: recombination protein RecR [Candidatus Schekmanbacteria bacterium RBG_16_38_11]|uniref:Recombination protein RecR n=2 Tax=Candidatus Schekmaniibacteriota TaxID=1817811 RepID=A0A1F7RKY4_9BACT|nr:MAG: recombination protein RecR [Candidatus Schekmanbacteria bacterium GWA2_38_11]OGL47179.1 MAG: recombination protein RecR [Candidatus Schekmanbacteria bacterium RBG_16_38_11]
MTLKSPSLEKLIRALLKLPGIGQKTANRLAFHILKTSYEEVKELGESILEVKKKILRCSVCFNITEDSICHICKDTSRDNSIICVVEDSLDLQAIENTREYKGLYHVLEGSLSPLDGVGPEQLRITELLRRLSGGSVKEIIVATNFSAEGEATAMYMTKILKPLGLKLTRIAYGLPVGGDLEYADEVTIAKAMDGRRTL